MWLSPRDLCDLVSSSLRAEVRYGIYYGTSRNTRRLWDLEPAMQDLLRPSWFPFGFQLPLSEPALGRGPFTL